MRQVKPRENLSLRRQCDLLEVSRSRLYYRPIGEKPENLKIMRIMDEHLTMHPTEGVRSMVNKMREYGFHVNPKRIRRLFRIMDYNAVYQRKNLSKLGAREYIKPYLLRGLNIDRPNQVWCTDITYIPMKKGFLYLTAIMDVYSRKILSWGISNTLDAQWCIDVFKDAVDKYGTPEIINSDQGSQYTSSSWNRNMEDLKVKISMDGKGRAIDNIWIERFWKTIKYNYLTFICLGRQLKQVSSCTRMLNITSIIIITENIKHWDKNQMTLTNFFLINLLPVKTKILT